MKTQCCLDLGSSPPLQSPAWPTSALWLLCHQPRVCVLQVRKQGTGLVASSFSPSPILPLQPIQVSSLDSPFFTSLSHMLENLLLPSSTPLAQQTKPHRLFFYSPTSSVHLYVSKILFLNGYFCGSCSWRQCPACTHGCTWGTWYILCYIRPQEIVGLIDK